MISGRWHTRQGSEKTDHIKNSSLVVTDTSGFQWPVVTGIPVTGGHWLSSIPVTGCHWLSSIPVTGCHWLWLIPVTGHQCQWNRATSFFTGVQKTPIYIIPPPQQIERFLRECVQYTKQECVKWALDTLPDLHKRRRLRALKTASQSRFENDLYPRFTVIDAMHSAGMNTWRRWVPFKLHAACLTCLLLYT
jgi:hypothetical protein